MWGGDIIRRLSEQNDRLLSELKHVVDENGKIGSDNKFLYEKVNTLRRENEELEAHCSDLQAQLDVCTNAQRLAEGRIEDIRATLVIERERYDRAIDHEREVNEGIRIKIGLVPRPANPDGTPSTTKGPRPVQAGRSPWSSVQNQLQKEARKQADQTEAHYKKRIEEVEKRDQELAQDLKDLDATDSSDTGKSGSN